jgi:hypothetical protein
MFVVSISSSRQASTGQPFHIPSHSLYNTLNPCNTHCYADIILVISIKLWNSTEFISYRTENKILPRYRPQLINAT